MAQNNTPIAEAPAVAAVNEEPVVPAAVEAKMERAESERESEARSNDNRDDRDGDDRDSRRGNRDRGERETGFRGQGPTDLMPELDASQQEGERKAVENGRAYEVSYIVNIANAEANDATQKRVTEMIEGAGGAVDNARTTEARRLAFPINKQTEGIYVVINARFNQTLIEELDRFFKLEPNVLRHIVLREGR